jgi:Glycosyltransferase family 9 (heptosyltransferase)
VLEKNSLNDRIPHNARWVVVTVTKPTMMRRSDDETWALNPKRRYILNADLLEPLASNIETMSDLHSLPLYKPLHAAPRVRLPGSSLLIERYRDRGIGDLLFTTGPMAYLHHATSGDIKIHCYAYAERGAVLVSCPYLAAGCPLVGPLIYSDLAEYNFHWFIDAVTDYCEERDQHNVYDALFHTLGIDPRTVDAKFKRPHASLNADDAKQLDHFMYWTFLNTKPQVDLRKTGYYLVAPFSNSALRSANYTLWFDTIQRLAAVRPVLIVGALRERMPSTDMSAGVFMENITQLIGLSKGRIISLLGKTTVRNLMQLISEANCVVSMDSAALYISQALRTPCVSLWGSHDPACRIGYDSPYMRLAIWHPRACVNSPCYAWQGFPVNRCPDGERQTVCSCLAYISGEEIATRVKQAEEEFNPPAVKPTASPQPDAPQPAAPVTT